MEEETDPPEWDQDPCLHLSPPITSDRPGHVRAVVTYECEYLYGHRGLHIALSNLEFTNMQPLSWDNKGNYYVGNYVITEDPV